MSKTKHWLWVVALVLALMAPAAWAEESSGLAGWVDNLVSQVVAAILGPEEPSQALSEEPGDEPELGEHVPIGG